MKHLWKNGGWKIGLAVVLAILAFVVGFYAFVGMAWDGPSIIGYLILVVALGCAVLSIYLFTGKWGKGVATLTLLITIFFGYSAIVSLFNVINAYSSWSSLLPSALITIVFGIATYYFFKNKN